MKAPIIEVRKLTKSFGKHTVLNEIDLSIPPDMIFGIIGESGSGKTTLLKSIIGFIPPEEGGILFEGRDVMRNMRNIRERFGFASQENCFYPKLTIVENLRFFGTLYGMQKPAVEQNIKKLLKLVELEDAGNVLGENLSSGMQRRLDIACSLIHNPKIIIMDEPTQDLDPVLRKEILSLIRKIKEEGTTVIMTSHLLHEAEAVCDEIAILHKGKVLEVGTPDQLKKMYSTNDEIHLETTPGRYDLIVKQLREEKDIVKVQVRKHKLILFTPKAEKMLHKLLHVLERTKEDLVDVYVRKPTLSEVFEKLVKE